VALVGVVLLKRSEKLESHRQVHRVQAFAVDCELEVRVDRNQLSRLPVLLREAVEVGEDKFAHVQCTVADHVADRVEASAERCFRRWSRL
jgi:hypothetical protein